MPEITVSIEGVQKLLQKLNPQKACGPDQIPARILRDLADAALSLASACNIPTSLSGAMPFVSFLSDLMYDQNLFCFGGLSS
jgi:hypothetical protein